VGEAAAVGEGVGEDGTGVGVKEEDAVGKGSAEGGIVAGGVRVANGVFVECWRVEGTVETAIVEVRRAGEPLQEQRTAARRKTTRV
jgi:hypothetical protein